MDHVIRLLVIMRAPLIWTLDLPRGIIQLNTKVHEIYYVIVQIICFR